jgi:FkbM family methyltransferase
MKHINHPFAWTNKLHWAWTDDDIKLLQVINDVNDVGGIIDRWCTERRTCIQAGAACGVWPFRLSLLFEQVITVEPLPDNFEAASANLAGRDNVVLVHGVLGSGAEDGGIVGMQQHPNEKHNAGSQQVQIIPLGAPIADYEEINEVFTIDELCATDLDRKVDFIALDLEGYELMALEGAAKTIERCGPTIMVEDKGLSSKFGIKQGAVVKHLTDKHGYSVASTIKRDVVMTR